MVRAGRGGRSVLDEGRAQGLSRRRVLQAEVAVCLQPAGLHVAVTLVECSPMAPPVSYEEDLVRAAVLKDDAGDATTVEKVTGGKVHALQLAQCRLVGPDFRRGVRPGQSQLRSRGPSTQRGRAKGMWPLEPLRTRSCRSRHSGRAGLAQIWRRSPVPAKATGLSQSVNIQRRAQRLSRGSSWCRRVYLTRCSHPFHLHHATVEVELHQPVLATLSLREVQVSLLPSLGKVRCEGLRRAL